MAGMNERANLMDDKPCYYADSPDSTDPGCCPPSVPVEDGNDADREAKDGVSGYDISPFVEGRGMSH